MQNSIYKKISTHVTRYGLVALLLAMAVLPVPVLARRHNTTPLPPSVTQFDAPATTPDQLQATSQWRQSSDLQSQINGLGATPVATFSIPILFGVGPSDISDNYGVLRASGHVHEGEDIMALKGTPIVSPTDAVVIRISLGATTGASEGNAVYTANPGGETFVYYHLDRVGESVTQGLVLKRGSLIGYIGNTGDAAGGAPHLHFEIRATTGNTPTNPYPRLTEEFSLQEKISYLSTILTQTTDPKTLAELLVTNFRGTFVLAQASNITLPSPILDALAAIPAGTLPQGGGISLPAGDLDVGSTGALVVQLQIYLIKAASGPAAARLTGAGPTGTFGSLTKAALVEYQTKAGISATGYYGPVTRTYILAHPIAGLPAPITTLGLPQGCTTPSGFSPITGVNCATGAPGPTTSTNTATLTRNLYLGVSGEDVRTLQRLLNAKGFTVALTGAGSAGSETIFFGNATKAAVIRFQIARGISPAIGTVGPITRAALAGL